jgi:uncharacterized protein with HEPN domain
MPIPMPPKKTRSEQALRSAISDLSVIEEYLTEVSREQFASDRMRQDAVAFRICLVAFALHEVLPEHKRANIDWVAISECGDQLAQGACVPARQIYADARTLFGIDLKVELVYALGRSCCSSN